MRANADLPVEFPTLAMRMLVHFLSLVLARQRNRGRTPLHETSGGAVVQAGEAEGLATEMLRRFGAQQTIPPLPPLAPLPPRFAQVVEAFDLRPLEAQAFLLAWAVEGDRRMAQLVAFLNDHAAHTRPTLGLIEELGEAMGTPVTSLDLLTRPLMRDGLLELEGEGPFSTRHLRLGQDLCMFLNGEPASASSHWHPFAQDALDDFLFPSELLAAVDRWAADGARRVLLIAGEEGGGRTCFARCAAQAVDRGVVWGNLGKDPAPLLRRLRRDARWHEAVLLLRKPAGTEVDWEAVWLELRELSVPLILEVAPQDRMAVALASPREISLVDLPPQSVENRRAIWQSLGKREGFAAPDPVPHLFRQYKLTPKQIAETFDLARLHRGGSLAEEPWNRSELEAACQELSIGKLPGLAQLLPLTYERKHLIVPPEVLEELSLAEAWIRQREKVLEHWNFEKRMPSGTGLTAIFHGPPGCGKTMAAQVLARELNLQMLRVDLAQLVDKYIGETEKNLSRLFDAAAASGAALFFDEADVIFGKRSEVRDAHDRYANLEIGYLLQRMELHDGVSILASNRLRDLDDAFVRRFHFILELPMPDERSRRLIWESMFPPESLEVQIDFAVVASRFELSGGEIRNCALASAFAAAGEGLRIGFPHLRRAIRRELKKNGRVVDESRFNGW